MTYLDFYKNLDPLLADHKLEEAISWCETEFQKTPTTDYHKILNKNLNHLIPSVTEWIEKFYNRVSKNIKVEAIYCEMNGFTINADLWFIDLFAFEKYLGLEDLYWLGDWKKENVTIDDSFVIIGFEEIQKKYEVEPYKIDEDEQASDFCEFLIILRLQELFKNAVNLARQKKLEWSNIPIIITAHDSELIYQTT
jgi:hypothetical protein